MYGNTGESVCVKVKGQGGIFFFSFFFLLERRGEGVVTLRC